MTSTANARRLDPSHNLLPMLLQTSQSTSRCTVLTLFVHFQTTAELRKHEDKIMRSMYGQKPSWCSGLNNKMLSQSIVVKRSFGKLDTRVGRGKLLKYTLLWY